MLTRDGLIEAFHRDGKPRERWRVGAELERHLLRPDGRPVPYPGPLGVRRILETLAPDGWKAKFEGENPVALFRDGASVTLEPGSQFELSSAPFRTVAEVEAQCAAFVHETDAAIAKIEAEAGSPGEITPVALGYTPFADADEIPWVPKGRYVVMRDHLGRTGPLAHHMMKSTCATQASFDFADERDCARKAAVVMRLGPLTTAIFANSPLRRGAPSGYMSFRGYVWTQTDPARTGFPEAAATFSFERWVDYLLDVPMMFLHNARWGWRPAHGATFRAWMRDGIDGVYPDEDAWELHLTSVFPEARIKRFIEIRGADCVPHPLAMGLPALFVGLLYDEAALAGAEALAERFAAHGTIPERFEVACRDGLAGHLGGRRLADWASELADLAAGGLTRWEGSDATLRPLLAQIHTGESPAASVLRAFEADPTPAGVLARHRYGA